MLVAMLYTADNSQGETGMAIFLICYPIALMLRSVRRRLWQRRLDQIAEISVRSGGPFGLYLRSFKADDRLHDTRRRSAFALSTLLNPFVKDFWAMRFSPGWWVMKRREKIEEIIYYSLNYKIPLIAIGKNDISYGVTRLAISDAEWKKHFCDLASRAAVIVCIPFPSEGSIWEIDWIREHARSKTVFLLPPANAKIEGSRYEEHWGHCVDTFAWLPIIPKLKSKWQVFRCPPNADRLQTWRWSLRNLKKAVQSAASRG